VIIIPALGRLRQEDHELEASLLLHSENMFQNTKTKPKQNKIHEE
jgi:hypothetical protein